MATRRNNRKWIWWGMGILIVCAVVVGVLLIINNNPGDEIFSDGDEQVQSQSSKEDGDKYEEKNEGSEEPAVEKKEEVKQYDGEDPNEKETLTGVISYAGVSGDNLLIRVNIDQYLGGGNCSLALIKDGATVYNSTVGIESSVSTSTCNGFTIPVAKIGSGEYTIEINLESDGKCGKMVGEVNI